MTYPATVATNPPAPETHHSYTRLIDQPAAGHDWSFVPSHSDWARLLSITATLTASVLDQHRTANVTVTDQNGSLIAFDPAGIFQDNDAPATYSWRPGNINYAPSAAATGIVSSIPGFWLPPGSAVAASTIGLDPGNPITQAFADTGSKTAFLPVVIVASTNDKFSWTGSGGGGPTNDYTIAPGTYTTLAQVAAAMNAATHTASPFSAQALVTVNGAANGYLVTAVADSGADGNNDGLNNGSSDDALASIVGAMTTYALAGGVDADPGDQWSNVVATYVVAFARYWETLDAMLTQVAAAR